MSHRRGRRPKKYSQVERIERMMRALASRLCTVNGLAQEFGVTTRQVRRDLDRIEEAGHPLIPGNDSGEKTWQLPLGYKGLPPITVSQYELMSLYLAKSHLTYLADTPFTDDLDGLIKKIEASLPDKTVNHLERIVQVFAPRLRPVRSYAKQKDILDGIRKALLLQKRLVLHYQKPAANKPIAYSVDPYALLLYQNGLYLSGYSHRSKSLRMFAVERIHKVTLTDDRFAIQAGFSTEAIGQRSFGVIDEAPQEVRIRFSKDVAYLLKERQWHPTQTISELKNGDVILTMQAGGLDEMSTWVLGWGPQAKVLSPPALVKLVAAELTAAARQYQHPR